MKKEEFIALGISEELAEKAEKESMKELEGYVTKEQLEAANTAKDGLEKDLKTRDKQLEELKKASGDNAELTQQIITLQEENKATKEKYDVEMKELKLTTAVKLAISNTAHDADLVAGLIDKSKLVLSEDGKVSGLEEQVKTLRESKSFLFKADEGTKGSEKAGKKTVYAPKAGEAAESSWAKAMAETMNKETSKNPYADAWETK